jgi:hypothetical protein
MGHRCIAASCTSVSAGTASRSSSTAPGFSCACGAERERNDDVNMRQ